MPHLLTDRFYNFPSISTSALASIKATRSLALTVEVLDIIAAFIFVAGSILFLPRYSANLQVFLHACTLFITGSAIYCVLCSLTLLEAIKRKGMAAIEVWENMLYLSCSWLFLIGSFLYKPTAPYYEHVAVRAPLSLGQICVMFSFLDRQSLGSRLFIIGSIFYTAAAFLNLLDLHARKIAQWSRRAAAAITALYMCGSLLFIVGSVAFLPPLGCGEEVLYLGAWCFISGSILFVVAGILSFWRTSLVVDGEIGEQVQILS